MTTSKLSEFPCKFETDVGIIKQYPKTEGKYTLDNKLFYILTEDETKVYSVECVNKTQTWTEHYYHFLDLKDNSFQRHGYKNILDKNNNIVCTMMNSGYIVFFLYDNNQNLQATFDNDYTRGNENVLFLNLQNPDKLIPKKFTLSNLEKAKHFRRQGSAKTRRNRHYWMPHNNKPRTFKLSVFGGVPRLDNNTSFIRFTPGISRHRKNYYSLVTVIDNNRYSLSFDKNRKLTRYEFSSNSVNKNCWYDLTNNHLVFKFINERNSNIIDKEITLHRHSNTITETTNIFTRHLDDSYGWYFYITKTVIHCGKTTEKIYYNCCTKFVSKKNGTCIYENKTCFNLSEVMECVKVFKLASSAHGIDNGEIVNDIDNFVKTYNF